MLIAVYLLIWAFSIGFFWVGTGPSDAMGYGLIFLYIIIPAATIIISYFVGRDREWEGSRWLMLLFFGVMYMLAPYATYSCANIAAFGGFRLPSVTDMLPGILCSAVGMLAGYAMARRERRAGKEGKSGA